MSLYVLWILSGKSFVYNWHKRGNKVQNDGTAHYFVCTTSNSTCPARRKVFIDSDGIVKKDKEYGEPHTCSPTFEKNLTLLHPPVIQKIKGLKIVGKSNREIVSSFFSF